MKDSRAEELIRSKIRAEEAENNMPDEYAGLWTMLEQRLEEKPIVSRRRHYALWAAASVVFAVSAGFYLYPRPSPTHRQPGLVAEQKAARPQVKGDVHQRKEETPLKRKAVAHTVRKTRKPKGESATPDTHATEESTSAVYAGLYAMPQVACAEAIPEPSQQCSQTF